MIVIKSEEEIELMAKAGEVTGKMLKEIPQIIEPGISTMDIDRWVEDYIKRHGMSPAFKGYGGFPGCACVSVNEEVVHGIPSKKKILHEGDIVSVDLGTVYKGYYSDAARTFPVGRIEKIHEDLIKTAEDAFFEGLKYCCVGSRLGDVESAIAALVHSRGFSVIRDYVGHGVGAKLHEDPQIPNIGKSGRGPRLAAGMVLAIEPMIAEGDWEIEVLQNDWTAVMVDGKYAAHYENTVAITEEGPRLLTCQDR